MPLPPITYFLIASSILFGLGLIAVLSRRNAILILVGIELMLNAANLNFIAFWHHADPTTLPAPDPTLTAPVMVMVSIALAAAEAAVGLAIILLAFRHTRSTDLNRLDSLHG